MFEHYFHLWPNTFLLSGYFLTYLLFWDHLDRDEEVKGWPPIQAYRKSSLGSLTKPSEENQQVAMAESSVQGHKNSLYVKVNMDGMPIGRKVDLNASKSYEILARDLEDMFQLTTKSEYL